ncbi:MAG: hypothetical protein Tsb0021_17900 [Chlamydiales bacterium]
MIKPSRRRSRRPITLIEVVIALILMSSLMTVILGFYFYVENTQQEITESRRETFRHIYMQYSLGNRLQQSTLKEEKETYWFYTSTDNNFPSLIFVYDNGVDGNPLFSNLLLAKLFVNQEKQLCLYSWPLPKVNFEESPPVRKEILMDHIEKLTFSFYQPPRRDASDRKLAVEDIEYGQWLKEWPMTKNVLPAMMLVNVEIKDSHSLNRNKKLTLSYLIPKTTKTILYTR